MPCGRKVCTIGPIALLNSYSGPLITHNFWYAMWAASMYSKDINNYKFSYALRMEGSYYKTTLSNTTSKLHYALRAAILNSGTNLT